MPVRGQIILAEDNEEFRTLLSEGLCALGFRVSSFANGKTALDAALAGRPPFVVLTDLCMPVASGFDLIDGLRERELLGPIPVVVLSGSNPDSIPGVPLLAKPADLGTISDMLDVQVELAVAKQATARALLSSCAAESTL